MAMANSADAELARKVEDYRTRESIYHSRLVSQEAEMNQLRSMASDILGAYSDASRAANRGSLSDPTGNMEVLMLRQKARAQELRISQLKEEMEANRFDQREREGQALMQKCKALLSENRELGEQMHEERQAELKAALQADQKQNAQQFQKCDEAAEFCKELSQENDKLQGTISKVAGRLLQARAELELVKKERAEAKAKRKQEKQQKADSLAAAAAAEAEAAASGVGLEVPEVVAPAPVVVLLAAEDAVQVLDDEEAEPEISEVAAAAGKDKKPNEKKEKKAKEERGEEKVKDRDRDGDKKSKKRKAELKPAAETEDAEARAARQRT
mmetsp:Transcript_48429/g.87016  ORF Transcript_48429/g.87016 Transcript_48429/m.87016 type:complete len:328 (+) Transcript_48429:106-1089(+)